MTRHGAQIKRNIAPSHIFISVFIAFSLLPSIYIALSNFYSNYWYDLQITQYRYAAKLALIVNTVFFSCFLFGFYYSKNIFPHTPIKKLRRRYRRINSENNHNTITIPSEEHRGFHYRSIAHKTYYWIAIVSMFFVWLNFFLGGYEKIALFGQDLSMMEYRLIGFNDKNRVLTALLQVARRLTLPFCAIYFILLSYYTKTYSKPFLIALLLSLFIGIIITLDRGPVMLLLIMFAYIMYCKSKNASRIVIASCIFVVAIFTAGGVLTFIQHNISDFSFKDVVDTGNNFLVNRVLMAPNFVPIELSYGLFDLNSEKLWLKYARISALFTGDYVGTLQENSLFVSPVGAVGDIWRNMGFYGIVPIGIFLGIYFFRIEELLANSDPVLRTAGSFTVITLVFYFLYGTFFSQGVFLQLIFLYVILVYAREDGAIYQP